MRGNDVFWVRKPSSWKFSTSREMHLPRPISNIGMPTAISRSVIIPRRFCGGDQNVKQPFFSKAERTSVLLIEAVVVAVIL